MIKRYSKRGEKTAVGRNFAVGYIDKSKRKKKPIIQLVKELNQSTLDVKKVGKNKYKVIDVVDFYGKFKIMTEKELRKRFG